MLVAVQCNWCEKLFDDVDVVECDVCKTDGYLMDIRDEPWGLNASRGYSIYGQETGLHDSNFI